MLSLTAPCSNPNKHYDLSIKILIILFGKNIAIKNADLSVNHVIWTNEQVVNKKAITLSDWGGVAMIESNIAFLESNTGHHLYFFPFVITNLFLKYHYLYS